MESLVIGQSVGHGCTLVAAVPVWGSGPDSRDYVIVAWRERDATFITWAAYWRDTDSSLVLTAGHYDIKSLSKAVHDMLKRANYATAQGMLRGVLP
jgi:hypothetical protein